MAVDLMKKRILFVGEDFGGIELSIMLSESLGEAIEVTLIDKGDAFTLGYAKLDVMLGRTTLNAVHISCLRLGKTQQRYKNRHRIYISAFQEWA